MILRLEAVEWRCAGFTLRVDAVWPGPVTLVSGASGAGKTSLLELIAGLRRPQAGRIVIDDEVVAEPRPGRWVPPEHRRIGYVPQDLALFPHLTAGQNLLFGRRAGRAGGPDWGRVVEVLEVGPLLDRAVSRLSGGEKQRIALGRALLAHPRFLLLDEPLTGLDDRLRDRVLSYIRTVIDEFQVPTVYVSHSRRELEAIGGDVFVLEGGSLSRRGEGAGE